MTLGLTNRQIVFQERNRYKRSMSMKMLTAMSISCLLFVSCTSSPAPKRQPREVRNQTRVMNKGVTQYTKGCYARALELFSEAHESYSVMDDLAGEASSLASIANAYFRLQDIESALLVYDDALELFRFLDHREGLTRTRVDKAAALIEAGRLDEASALLDQADAQASGGTAALRFKTRALLAAARKDFPVARIFLEKAQASSQGAAPSVISGIHYARGYLALISDEPRKALKPLQTALDIDRRAEAYADIAKDLQALARCYGRLDQDRQALTCLKRSVKIHALLGNSPKVQAMVPELQRLAGQTGMDIKATLHWVSQWLAGQREFNVCR